jgi:hypothetical protein
MHPYLQECVLRYFACFLVACLLPFASTAAKPKPVIVGWVEKVHIDSLDTVFKAKLDTGAQTSSIDAKIIDIVKPEKDDDDDDDKHGRVIFSVEDNDGKARTLERRINRYVRIKTKTGGYLRRPVVTMTFCIAGIPIKEEVNLADREHFIYPVLIGRNMLKDGRLVIDASTTFTSDADCEDESDKDKD